MSDDFRILLLVLASLGVFAVALTVARRFNPVGGATTLTDAGLLTCVAQYVAVGAAGMIGQLNFPVIVTIAAAGCGTALWATRHARTGPPPPATPSIEAALPWGIGAFACALVVGTIVVSRLVPPLSDDVLTYHFPAAAQWLRAGRIGVFETWDFNPANAFSPLAGSVFSAWLMAPLAGDDVAARFVQAPAVGLIFLGVYLIAGHTGAKPPVAAALAAAAGLSRVVLNQALVPKDDLFVAAFGLLAVAALLRRGPHAAVRCGAAVGLMLATKYTAVLTLPLVVAALRRQDFSPRRWRGWVLCATPVLLLAGPWYARNAWLTGSPIYPVRLDVLGVTLIDGPIATAASPALRSTRSIWAAFTEGYFANAPVVVALTLLGWAAGAAVLARHVGRLALARVAVLGVPACFAVFILVAPYPETRFVYPAVCAMWAVAGAAVARLPWRLATAGLTAVVGVVVATGRVAPDTAATAAVAGVVGGATVVWRLARPSRRTAAVALSVAGLTLLAYGYVAAQTHLADVRAARYAVWRTIYGPLGDAWAETDRLVPPGETIAYANTNLVLPLAGATTPRRAVVCASGAREIEHLWQLPRLNGKLDGEQINARVVDARQDRFDGPLWWDRLAARGARYVFVAKRPLGSRAGPPPELTYARSDAPAFELVYENEAAVLFRLVGP